MSFLCWNCRGLGTDATVGELKWLVGKFRPSLLFLSETKMRDSRARKFMWQLGFNGSFAVSSDGLSGGLVLFWSSSISVSLRAFSNQIIDILIKTEEGAEWRTTFVYGEPKRELRHHFWDRLRFLNAQWKGPWICAGDFNEALHGEEHMGVRGRDDNQMMMFRECLDECGLIDLGYIGPKYTWSNRQEDGRNVRVRLDRAIANGDFLQLFDDCTVENIITTSSDHLAILVKIANKGRQGAINHVLRSFKFEAAWTRAPDYVQMINENWGKLKEGPPSLNNTWSALNRLSTTLQTWSRESFGSVKKEIKKLEKKLASLRRNNMAIGYSREEKEVEKKLYEMFEREEIMAKQRSRIDWLHEGDRNTSFFHARASARRRTNKIKALRRVDGSLCEDPEGIRSMVHDFYSNMFTSEPCDSLELVLEAIPCKVTEDMNEDLCKEYTNEEIRTALFQMGPTKAPGPDGFPALFYQIHWDVLAEDICAAIKGFLLGQDIPEGFCDSQKEASGQLKGIRNGRNGPPISHLLFADDSVFFTRGDNRSTNALKSVLQSYCEGSGQRINLQKSSIFFGLHCDVQIKDFVKQTLGVQDETLQTTYLGMPTWVGRSPTSNFNFLPGRIWKRLNGCSDRPLSRAGKEVLLKSVAQAIPTYVMSCFQIPLSICEKMRQPISNFWWGIEDGKKKLHWRSWDWLSSPKYVGGLGFRDMAIFNQAMLGKQCWRLLTEPNSLCAQVLRGRYYPNGDFWTAQCPRSSSYVWRSIMHGKKLIRKGILWRVGNGKGSSSKQDYLEKVWKRLWAIQCPNKMKIMLWRIAHNCLPTGSQLQTRSIPTRV
ncbi:unnamed protein product [Triticum turgidum subsp. durum]|uniref:Endonuclease/exonuclease/phosphatase domain-containing protein n=1 Tax=Triticum turgidum subsp. durum TaxID=4567 RepID=A0A9R0X2Z7_TRITD|nr:unnamed protein product [Triticum turgidum subsp. durum]